MIITLYAFRLLILFQSLEIIDGKLHRLDTIYQYSSSKDLMFHCEKGSDQKSIIVIYSKDHIGILADQMIHSIQQDYWYQMYSATQCLKQINITSSNNFQILQRLESPIQLNLINSHQLYRIQCKLMQFKFSISKQQLFIISIDSYIELQEQFAFILTNGIVFYKLQRAEDSNYIHVLGSDNYELFILGPANLLVSIQLQIEYVGSKFIWINKELELFSEEFKQQFDNLIEKDDSTRQIYVQLIIGSCNVTIQSSQELAESELARQLTLYNYNLYILQISFTIVFTGKPLIILYQSLQQIQNYVSGELIIYTKLPYNPISVWFINPLEFEINNNEVQLIQTFRNHEYCLDLQSSEPIHIFHIQIQSQTIEIKNQDIYQLLLPWNSSILCKVILDRYLFSIMIGQFNSREIEYNLIQIDTQEDTIVDFIKPQIRQFQKVVFDQVYKSRGTSKFYFTLNYQRRGFKIHVFPTDIQFQVYYDYELKQRSISGNEIDIAQEGKQYRYVVITDNINYYIQFQRGGFNDISTYIGQGNATILLNTKRITLDSYLFENLYFFGFQEIEYQIVQRHENITLAIFKEVNPLIIVVKKQIYPFQKLFLNEFHLLFNNRIYLFYLQRNFVILILDEFHQIQQFQVTIINPQLEVLYNIEDTQDIIADSVVILDETSVISIQSKFLILNLSFFECQRLDCVVQLQLVSEEYNNSIKCQICLDVNVGLMYITETLYACQSLEQFDIIPLSNNVQVYFQYNLIQCQDIQCPIIIKYPNMTLDQIQESISDRFRIKLNELNVNIYNHFTHIIFYNNFSQQIYIHTDNQNFELKRLIGTEYLPINKSSGVIDQGYYSVISDNQMYSYLTVFTYPTLLYENKLISAQIKLQQQIGF